MDEGLEFLLAGVLALAVAGVVSCLIIASNVGSLRHRVTLLEHACGPVDTGGGVVQCAQPNLYQVKPR